MYAVIITALRVTSHGRGHFVIGGHYLLAYSRSVLWGVQMMRCCSTTRPGPPAACSTAVQRHINVLYTCMHIHKDSPAVESPALALVRSCLKQQGGRMPLHAQCRCCHTVACGRARATGCAQCSEWQRGQRLLLPPTMQVTAAQHSTLAPQRTQQPRLHVHELRA